MDMSDDVDKSWNHPWTTEEMKKKRREWSLAGDVGLLKHLQEFSENLVSKANNTQAALNTLTTQLKETEILVSNVTNTSLALANTQFIESRVQEDDIEIKQSSEEKQENAKLQDMAPESLLASISKSVKQGLNIMDKKYKVMDVACSDSEEEDDDGAVVFSVIVEPNNPYQDRPLPYVIGSNKWTTSNKIGLESSSSESEQADEERDESESEKEEVQKVFNSRHNPEINIARLSSSSSDSDNYNDPNSNLLYMNNNKVDAISQNINSASETTTPNNISKTSSETAPNFAEELAKRLGNVRQAQKPAVVDEASESSINRFKDDLFASEKDVFNDDTNNLFSDKKGFFNDQSANLWKEKSIKSYKNNIIPASIDVPPPISIVSTKPKSAIDDLFADADSEEDSDIFSSKHTIKKRTKEFSDNTHSMNTEDKPKKFLDVVARFTNNIATSTPDSKISGLFSDDENDDTDLFGNSKKQSHKSPSTSLSTNTIQESNRKEPVGGVSLLNNALMSDMENKLLNRIMQRQQESSDSSDSEAPGNSDNTTRSNVGPASSQWNALSDIIMASENVSAINENSNNTSGIRSTSINNTLGSALLSGTLKTYQRAACDEETMTLKCPPGTTISVEHAQYGRAGMHGISKCNSSVPPMIAEDRSTSNHTCIWPQSLQMVVGVCQKKRQCKFNTNPKTFQGDPCPGLKKYIEVAYKCRPYEFRSKVACENDIINLVCHPGQRVAIFSASFGRTQYESLQCPQPRGVKEETCSVDYATETIMNICHGKRRCSVVANSTTFDREDPCRPDSRTYLKVVYTCVPRSVLRERYADEVEPDEFKLLHEFDEGFDTVDFGGTEFSPSPNVEKPQPQPRDNVSRNFPTVSSSPPRARTNNDVDARLNLLKSLGIGAKDLSPTVIRGSAMTSDNGVGNATSIPGVGAAAGNCTTVVYAFPEEDRLVVGYLNEWINAYSFITNNQEKFYLYIIISVSAGILLFLGLIIGRLLVSRHRAKREAKFHANNETLPNGFTDDISEIDADIDLTTAVPVPMQDTRLPETQLAERLHGERYYADTRIPLSPTTIHAASVPHATNTGMRVDLGNHMVGTDNLHTILRTEDPRSLNSKSYYYG